VSTEPFDDALARRLVRRSAVSGEVTLPAVPSMLEHHVQVCADLFAAVGRAFDAAELEQLRRALGSQLDRAFAASPRSSVVISYEAAPGSVLTYLVNARWSTLEEAYDHWVSTREPPLFGTEPDARVWALAGEAADPSRHRVLDVGGGTGRNALALARRGHPVDVVEMTAAFADDIRSSAAAEGLEVRVIQRDVFDGADDLRADYDLIVLSEVVPDLRTTSQLRALFELAARRLAPAGRLVLNAFLPRPGYEPDDAVRELGQQLYSAVFTRQELGEAVAGLPLHLVSDDSVLEVERTHLPEGTWPPTSWYPDWITGRDVFLVDGDDDPPIELRWLVYERR
jgi:SAM-dependent methyltransferase